MRSHILIRRSRSLLRPSTAIVHSIAARPRLPRKEIAARLPRSGTRAHKRLASSTSTTPPIPSTESDAPPVLPSSSPDDPPDDKNLAADKPKRRTTKSSRDNIDGPPQLPHDLDILWTPETNEAFASSPQPPLSIHLPPPQIFEDALTNLQITLHPKTQHRAMYSSHMGPPVEPTLALYCPIEGGEYVIDETVRELARRTGAEVVILDSVQLAAGEWGHFGKAANSLQLPRNPLHFSSANPTTPPLSPRQGWDEEEESDMSQMITQQVPMTLTVVGPAGLRGRALIPSTRTAPSPSKVKILFDEIVNVPSKEPGLGSTSRPRLVYIRDFSTLAPTSSVWYPHLLSAVRQRRQGPMSRPSSPIPNPVTIVFGITPSITPPAQTSGSGSGGLFSMLLNRNHLSSSAVSSSKPGKSDWSEDEHSDKAREKRLRVRLRKWEKGDASIQEELPMLCVGDEVVEEGNTSHKPEIVLIGGGSGGSGTQGPMASFPPFLSSALMARGSGNRGYAEIEGDARFFRVSVLVPALRSLTREHGCRVSRRREINELTMRMAVGSVGGALESRAGQADSWDRVRDEPLAASAVVDGEPAVASVVTDGAPTGVNVVADEELAAPSSVVNGEPAVASVVEADSAPPSDEEMMWDNWGKRVEAWANVRRVADRVVGSVVGTAPNDKGEKASLEPTAVPWSAVPAAWAAQRASQELRKTWAKESSGKTLREQEEAEEDAEKVRSGSAGDELVERIKQDPDLDQHEQRLLPCIVSSASMPTTFSQVHLPPHTIDSVRTIVSLPLLHPAAFRQGILKEYGMTGCLLFGPPGTGKTLVVRALAKEAGCRMIAISPSDVMDMYVGEGEKLVKAVFSLARRLSPCVVFLDEIDALFGARMSARESGGAFAHRGVITEFMQEMDGLKSSKEDSVIVIGATNRPFDLDDAVLRRLPRRLLVDLPGEREREEILKILLRDEVLDNDISLADLAKKTETFSGSDLKHLCVSAALDAVKEHVDLPWAPKSPQSASTDVATPKPTPDHKDKAEEPVVTTVEGEIEQKVRSLSLRHFTKALKEITPSSSESLGTLTDLRRWNEEFGEGHKHKRKSIWGKDRFGFTNRPEKADELGRVGPLTPTADSLDARPQ